MWTHESCGVWPTRNETQNNETENRGNQTLIEPCTTTLMSTHQRKI